MKNIVIISFILYVAIIGNLLFFSSRGLILSSETFLEYMKRSTNLVPFQTIQFYFEALKNGTMNPNTALRNLYGNVIVFLPMGLYIPFFVKRIHKLSSYFTIMTIVIITVECLQLVTMRGSFDIDDYILNIIGAVIGYAIWKNSAVQKIYNLIFFTEKDNRARVSK